jgi:hypothetical protein
MLEDDLQGDFSIRDALDDLRVAVAAGSRVEITGNAHTISVEGGNATVVCDDDPTMSATRVSTADLIELVLAWQSFRARGTPEGWSNEA